MYAGGVARIEDCIDADPFTQCIRGEIVTLHLIISYKYSTTVLTGKTGAEPSRD